MKFLSDYENEIINEVLVPETIIETLHTNEVSINDLIREVKELLLDENTENNEEDESLPTLPAIIQSNTNNNPPLATNEADGCVICFTNKKEYILTPCGHLCLCENCSHNPLVTTCPVCRSCIRDKTKIYNC